MLTFLRTIDNGRRVGLAQRHCLLKAILDRDETDKSFLQLTNKYFLIIVQQLTYEFHQKND